MGCAGRQDHAQPRLHPQRVLRRLPGPTNGKANAEVISVNPTLAAHQAGTARFGTAPATSVLDLDCKAYEPDNLYVVDASFFPSIGAVNPTLTIIANTLRVADRIAERPGGLACASAATTGT